MDPRTRSQVIGARKAIHRHSSCFHIRNTRLPQCPSCSTHLFKINFAMTMPSPAEETSNWPLVVAFRSLTCGFSISLYSNPMGNALSLKSRVSGYFRDLTRLSKPTDLQPAVHTPRVCKFLRPLARQPVTTTSQPTPPFFSPIFFTNGTIDEYPYCSHC